MVHQVRLMCHQEYLIAYQECLTFLFFSSVNYPGKISPGAGIYFFLLFRPK